MNLLKESQGTAMVSRPHFEDHWHKRSIPLCALSSIQSLPFPHSLKAGFIIPIYKGGDQLGRGDFPWGHTATDLPCIPRTAWWHQSSVSYPVTLPPMPDPRTPTMLPCQLLSFLSLLQGQPGRKGFPGRPGPDGLKVRPGSDWAEEREEGTLGEKSREEDPTYEDPGWTLNSIARCDMGEKWSPFITKYC